MSARRTVATLGIPDLRKRGLTPLPIDGRKSCGRLHGPTLIPSVEHLPLLGALLHNWPKAIVEHLSTVNYSLVGPGVVIRGRARVIDDIGEYIHLEHADLYLIRDRIVYLLSETDPESRCAETALSQHCLLVLHAQLETRQEVVFKTAPVILGYWLDGHG